LHFARSGNRWPAPFLFSQGLQEQVMSETPIFPEGEGALIVTDLQREFLLRDGLPARSAIESAYCEIHEADRRGWGIVQLSYNLSRYGAVHEGVARRIRSAKRWIAWERFGQDGSLAVLSACLTAEFNLELLRFCGINANACVFDTAVGVCRNNPSSQVEVSAEATKTTIRNYNWWHYGREEAKRIKLVRWNRELIVPGPRTREQEAAEHGYVGMYGPLGR
jgi:hypothetical protein